MTPGPSMRSPYGLDPSGYFTRDGKRFVPVGVNYWPASCGVEMWQRWPADEIRHDLDVLVRLGLNAVRFFQRWQDFEPRPGKYDAVMFGRLKQLLDWCRERGLAAHPSLFVGWMSGGIFWPAWREGRNVFADPFMAERAVAFTRRSSEAFAEYADVLLAVDQGNELCCLPDSREAPPAAVRAWCAAVSAAVHEACPGTLVVSGNEQAQLALDTGWRLDDQPGCDLYSMHTYPVPPWHPIAFDGMTDPLGQHLLPFYAKTARAFGPTFVQEFGTILPFGRARQQAYLHAILPACWQAGANGFLYWCMRDIVLPAHPYLKNPFERSLGLVDAQDRIKPGLEVFIDFTRSLATRPAPDRTPGDVGLYFPRHYYHRDAPANPGNEPGRLCPWLTVADYLLTRIGRSPTIVRGDRLSVPAEVETLCVSGALLDLEEIQALCRWVAGGGRLIWHGVDPFAACDVLNPLLGAEPVDFRWAKPSIVSLFDQKWPVGLYQRGTRTHYEPTTATVLSADEDGVPQVLLNRYGRGGVFWTVGVPEHVIAAAAGDRPARDRWTAWYRGAIGLLAAVTNDRPSLPEPIHA